MGTIKTVGSSGQISLDKKLAGQTVMIDEMRPLHNPSKIAQNGDFVLKLRLNKLKIS